jgi:hypothetical protein
MQCFLFALDSVKHILYTPTNCIKYLKQRKNWQLSMSCSDDISLLQNGYEQLASAPLEQSRFWPAIANLTSQSMDRVRAIFHAQLPELAASGAAVACTGSDGRLEKCGLGSPVECIVLLPEGANVMMAEKIRTVCQNNGPLLFPEIDTKRLGLDFASTYEREGIEPRVIPTRAFDAVLMAGNEAAFAQYKHLLIDELANKRIPLESFKKTFLNDALQNLRSELRDIPKKNPLVSVSSGTVYYEKTKRRGLKHDALRAVQYACAYTLFKGIQSGRISEEESAQIPHSVLERITWLKSKKLIPLADKEQEDLRAAYTQASYWYSQVNIQAMREGATQVRFEASSLRSTLQQISDLSQRLLPLPQ